MNKLVCYFAAVSMTFLVVACSSPTPTELLDMAQQAFSRGEFRTADIYLRNLLRDDPNDAEARVLLAQVSIAVGDGVAAESNLDRARELGVDTERLQLPLLQALGLQGDFTRLLDKLETGPALEGEARVMALRLSARAHQALGEPGAAEAAYREAIELAPESTEVRAELAELLVAMRRFGDARELVGGLLRVNRRDPAALVLRGRLELAAARNDAAAATFREVLEIEDETSRYYRDALAQLVVALLGARSAEEAVSPANDFLALEPNNPVARFLKASVEAELGDVDSASRRLESVIAEFPTFMPATRLLGAISLDRGNVRQAQMYLQSAVTGDPADERARGLLAETLLRQGEIDAARRLLAPSLAEAGSDALMLALAGRANLRAGDADRADALFDQSEQDTSVNQQQLITLAMVYVGAGETERASRVLERTELEADQRQILLGYLVAVARLRQGDVDGAREAARALNEQQPGEPWPLNLQGSIAFLVGDLAGARERFTAALEADRNNVQALLNLGRVVGAEDGARAAVPYFERVLEIDAAQPLALLGLAQIALDEGRFGDARRLVTAAPESLQRTLLEAALAEAEGRHAEAAVFYQSAFRMQPSRGLALRAFAAARRASLPDPAAALRAWVDDRPDDAQGLFALGGYELETGNEASAIRRFNAVLAAAPDHIGALNNLAWLLSQRGDDGALQLAERAYAIAPDDPAVVDTLGWLKLQSGDAAGALPLLEHAAAGAPEHLEIQFHLAAVLAETGDVERAVEMLEQVVTRADQAAPWREDAERRLARIKTVAGE